MKKDRKTQILTGAVLLTALGVGLARKTTQIATPPAGQDPQSTIYAMLNAARAGNVQAYLASYTGPMEATLRHVLAETAQTDFAKYLQDSNASIKGVAVSDPQITDLTATVRVEYVYQDRNEAQMMYLAKWYRGWKIFRADGDERIRTLIPYGTPVK
jgi:hypothetical protein